MKKPIRLYNLINRTAYKLDINMESPKFTLNKTDWSFITDRAKLFLLPLVLVYFGAVTANIEKDGLQLTDFAINAFQAGAIVLYLLNRATTAIQLWMSGKKAN
jgi:hypothetical protein